LRLSIVAAGLIAALTLTACASTPARSPITPATPGVDTGPPTIPSASNLPGLPGWATEDHRAALEAFRAGCPVSKDAATMRVCTRARALGRTDEGDARRFLEANFRAEPVGGDGLLTAYFAPQYEARRRPSAEFSAPVRPKPDDMVSVPLAAFEAGETDRTLIGQDKGGKVMPYPDRAAIEAMPPAGALAWMRPEDLYFLQIQGSGLLTFEDGRRLRAAFAAHNGRTYVGIAAPMRQRGLLPDNNTSGDNIRAWLAAHRGPEAAAVMALNPRYVFFNLGPDDGREAVGAAGVPLPAGRAIAVDVSQNALGGLYWIDAEAPKLAGAFPTYRRAAVALDTGGAIKGAVRADLYMGTGDAAGTEAGRVRHTLRLYRLVPVS